MLIGCIGPLRYLPAQNILIVEKSDFTRNYKYQVDDRIIVKTATSPVIIRGSINKIGDSALMIDYLHSIQLKDIEKIYRPMLIKSWLSPFLTIAGLGYVALDVTNNLLSDIGPVFNGNVLLTGGILLSSGLLFYLWPDKVCDMKEKWHYKVLNFNELDKP